MPDNPYPARITCGQVFRIMRRPSDLSRRLHSIANMKNPLPGKARSNRFSARCD